MFRKLFETAAQRADRESLEAYDSLVLSYFERKRLLRRATVLNFVSRNEGCSFLMSDHDDNFLVLDPAKRTIFEGKLVDRFLNRPDFLPDDASREARLEAIAAYQAKGPRRLARLSTPGDDWFFANNWEQKVRSVRDDFIGRTHHISSVIFAVVRRNGVPLCSINARSPKQHLYFASYLPSVLAQQRASTERINSTLTIELVFPSHSSYKLSYYQTYDDFHKHSIGKRSFDSMVQMVVEFLTIIERMVHDASAGLEADDWDEGDVLMVSIRNSIPDLQCVPGW